MGNISKHEYYDCDICGTRCKKKSTLVQEGLRRCKRCYDTKPKVGPSKWAYGTGRANPLTTTAIYSPTIFSITAAGGITPSHSIASELTYSGDLELSNLPSSVVFGSSYYMKVVGSGGAIDIVADPQIANGRENDIIVLEGTSDTNTVTLDDGTGLSLTGSIVLGLNDRITLRFNGSTWVEINRYLEPVYN